MTSVLVFIIIPDANHEKEIKEKEIAAIKSKKKKIKKELSDNLTNEKNVDENGEIINLENIVRNGLEYFEIPDSAWTKTCNDNYWQITFPVDLEDSDQVLQYFKSRDIGRRFTSSIGIIPFNLFCYNEEIAKLDLENQFVDTEIKEFKEKQSKFLKSITARLTVAQVVDSVRSQATLTFDFICYLIFASWIAAMGLLDNSVISLVASMLVSPMMGPVMALTFGTIIRDRSLRRMGFSNIFVCLFVTIAFGFCFGMIALNFTEQWSDSYGAYNKPNWPTDMMRERGLTRIFWVGTLVAFPSGCAVAISLLSGNDASLVGVAISVSLLPPAVNAGLLWAYSFLKYLYSLSDNKEIKFISKLTNKTSYLPAPLKPGDDYYPYYDDNMSIETLYLGLLSLCLSLINIANIIIGALLLLKIKEIAPLTSMSPEKRRFFKEDIKIAREYNANNPQATDLGQEILKEYADIAGVPKEELMRPEALNVQLNTLADMIKDVQSDDVFQTVTKSIGQMNPDKFRRRLSHSLFNQSNSAYSRRATLGAIFNNQQHSAPVFPSIVITEPTTKQHDSFYPSPDGPYHGRRRISQVALHDYENNQLSPKKITSAGATNGITNKAFTFDEQDVYQHTAYERNRRGSSSALRATLMNSERSPFSLWPSTSNSRFTVVSHPLNEEVNETAQNRQMNDNNHGHNI